MPETTPHFDDVIFDQAVIGMAVVTLDCQWIKVNSAFCNILGYSPAELASLSIADVLDAGSLYTDAAEASSSEDNCILTHYLQSDEEMCDREIRCTHKGGHLFWVKLSTSLIEPVQAQSPYFFLQMQDISKHWELDADFRSFQLEKSHQAETRALLRSITDVILVRDFEGRCIRILPTQAKNLYRSVGDMLGKTLHETFPQTEADTILGYVHQSLQAQQPIQGEYTLMLDSKAVHMSAIFSPVASDRVVIVTHDITARKKAEQTTHANIDLLQQLTLALHADQSLEDSLTVMLKAVCEAHDWIYGEAWIPNLSTKALECSPAYYCSADCSADYLVDCSATAPLEVAADGDTNSTDSYTSQLSALQQFRKISETFFFPAGIGLPGRVWAEQQPEWCSDVSSETDDMFLRQDLAKTCGIKAGVGIPLVANGEVLAVLVFFKLTAVNSDPHMISTFCAAAAQLDLIVQRRKVAAAIEAEREIAQATLNTLEVALITTDRQGHVQSLNPSAEWLTGWRQTEVRHQPVATFLKLLHPQTREAMASPIDSSILQSGIVIEPADSILINRQGHELSVRSITTLLRSHDNHIIGAVLALQTAAQCSTVPHKRQC